MPPLTIWTNHRFAPAEAEGFERAVAPHRVIHSHAKTESVVSAGARDPELVESADVAFGQPDPQDIFDAKRLRLVCLTSAGYTRYDRDDLRAHCRSHGIAFANASGVYDEPCAQHAFAMVLSLARELPSALDSQRSDRRWPTMPLRAGSVIVGPRTPILVAGYGAIARRLVELLKPFNAPIVAFRRSPRGGENCETRPIDHIDAALPSARFVINILPASGETTDFFDAERLGRLQRGATFINIGRGDTVDQAALLAALTSGRLGSAYLDVTSPEPLPPDHPLWSAPNCFITPHTAGGSEDEPERQIAHFAEQLARFTRGEPVAHRVF